MSLCRYESCAEPTTRFSVFCAVHQAEQLRQLGIVPPARLSWTDRLMRFLEKGILTRQEIINSTIDELTAGIDSVEARKLHAVMPADLFGALVNRLNELQTTGYQWKIRYIPGPADAGPPGVFAKALETAHGHLIECSSA